MNGEYHMIKIANMILKMNKENVPFGKLVEEFNKQTDNNFPKTAKQRDYLVAWAMGVTGISRAEGITEFGPAASS